MLTSNRLTDTETRDRPAYFAQSRIGVYWWLTGAAVALVALLLYSLTRFGQFQGEDFTLLRQLSSERPTLGNNLGYFGGEWGLEGQYYAPLPRLVFYLEHKAFGNVALGWHLFSTGLHALCAVLVWGLAWLLTRRPALAFCAGLFFAVQPVHVPVIAQPSGQADLWAALFCLASAVAFIAARQNHTKTVPGGRFYYPLAVAFYGLALLSKQDAILLPFALLGYDFVTSGLERALWHSDEAEPETDSHFSHFVISYIPFAVLLLLYIGLNLFVLGGFGAFVPVIGQKVDLGEFLRGNLRLLSQPFGLGGTDGLILLAALAAFTALVGVQEWEAWRLNKLYPKEPNATLETAAHPAYWSLRAGVYGFLWNAVFVIPFLLLAPSQRTLYVGSAGFAIFLAAALAPFGTAIVHRADPKRARALFGQRELSFWMRLAAVIAISLIYFAASTSAIDAWNTASRAFAVLSGS